MPRCVAKFLRHYLLNCELGEFKMNLKLQNQLKNSVKLIQLGILISTIGAASANSEFIEDQFSGEIPIDIDGNFSRPTESDRLEQMRKKLEKQNEEMVQKKIEDIRVDNEKKLTKQLQSALTGHGPLSSVGNTVQESTSVEEKTITTTKSEGLVDLGLNIGVSNVSGAAVDLETSLSGKISIESKLKENLLMGIGIGYTNISMRPLTDVFGNSYYSAFYGNGNYNVSGEYGQTIDYNQFDISTNAKLLLSKSSRLKPFIGLGLVYSRFNIKNNGSNIGNWSNGVNSSATIDGSFLSLNANLGARLMFTDLIGMNLELGYTRGVGGILGNRSTVSLLNPNSLVLNDIAAQIATSNIFGIQTGLIFSF